MKSIGLTGGIGSGKTLVSRIFKILGIPVYEADPAARALMETHPLIREKLTSWFGDPVYLGDRLNRTVLAGHLFSNPGALEQVNSLVHPLVVQDYIQWVNTQSGKPYVLHEAAILFETGIYHKLDATILVTAPEHLRIERVMERDRTTRDKVVERLTNQWPDSRKEQLADFIIRNDGHTAILPQVLDIHQRITVMTNG
ncbi:MAG: dephospho-CoA kinase [Bacteroidales bacterium]